jgi:hypothetical protein
MLRGNPWWELATRVRQARFYLRFLDPVYRGMPALLVRTRERAPRTVIRLAELPGVGRLGRALMAAALSVLDQSTRTPAAFHQYLRERRPDVVVLTPLVVLKTTQLDQARDKEFDRLFLTFMIQHHSGAVTMVEDLFRSEGAALDDTVFKLASDISADQTTEIERMQQMLAGLMFGPQSP